MTQPTPALWPLSILLPHHASDWVSLIEARKALCGENTRAGRACAFWRRTSGPHVSIDHDKKTWHDFGTGIGGGMLDLVQIGLACGKSDAVAWLIERAGLQDEKLDATEVKQRRALADHERELSAEALCWAAARCRELEEEKAQSSPEQLPMQFVRSARALYTLESLDRRGVIEAYIKAQRKDPAQAARYVRLERERLAESKDLTWKVVDLLCSSIPQTQSR